MARHFKTGEEYEVFNIETGGSGIYLKCTERAGDTVKFAHQNKNGEVIQEYDMTVSKIYRSVNIMDFVECCNIPGYEECIITSDVAKTI